MPHRTGRPDRAASDGIDQHTDRPFRFACANCGYALSDLPRGTPCPECNHRGPRAMVPVDDEPLRRAWLFWLTMGALALVGMAGLLLTIL